MTTNAFHLVLALFAIVVHLSARASCPETPERLPQPMWAFARANAASVAGLVQSDYRSAVVIREIRPFYAKYPVTKSYAYNGSVYAYVVIRSAFCQELLVRFRNPDDIDRKFRLHDAILAENLHLSPF